MKLPSLSFLAQAFFGAWRRFPFTMISAAIGVAILMAAIENNKGDDDLMKVWMMAQIGLPFFTGLVAFAESKAWSFTRKMALQAGGLGLLVLYFFFIKLHAKNLETVQLPRYIGFLAIAHLIAAVAPYLNRLSVADFWEYNKQLFANFIVGAAYTLILFSGLSLALLAVNELFALDMNQKIYAHLFVLLAGIFNTSFFLAHFPTDFTFEEQERTYNVIFKNLCQYILIPIVGLYFLILYAYSIKIILTWSLPKGWVSSLVLGFSVAGIFTYLLNYLLPENSESKVVHAYRRWFWWVLLPMVGLLFAAIGRRIADYGVTEERYFVAHAGLWLFVMCVYFLWSKSDNIKFIPISLALFILPAILGPLSAFRVAQRSQATVLHHLLEQNGRFDGEKLKPGNDILSGDAAERIQSALNFLERREALDQVDPWLPIPWQAMPGYTENSRHADLLADWLKIETNAASPAHSERARSVYPNDGLVRTANVAGYKAFYRLELYEVRKGGRQRPSDQFASLTADGANLVLQTEMNKTAPDTFNLAPLMQKWIAADTASAADIRISEPFFELHSKKLAARLYLQEARFDPKKQRMENLYGLLFVK